MVSGSTPTKSRLRIAVAATIAAVATAAAALFAIPNANAATTPTKIMLLGDSITGNNGCWRALLWQHLQSSGYTNIDYVGTMQNTYCTGTFDADNEGHGGYLATNIASQNLLPTWLSTTTPDIVVMHLGTNDVWNALSPATILSAFSTLLTQMRANNPNVKLVVAQIIPLNPSGCSDCPQRVIDFNAAIPAWATANSTSQSPITVVDQWTGFDTATDTSDGVHPNETTGIQKLEARWYPALVSALGTTPSNPASSSASSSSAAPSSPTTSSPAASSSAISDGTVSCSASFAISSSWNGGFVASVKVTAGGAAIKAWKVTLVLPSGATVANAWNGVTSGTTGTVTVTNASYNGTLSAGGSTEFGFQGTGTATGTTATCTATA